MAHPSMLRLALQMATASLFLIAVASPAFAGYKLLIKGPVCSAPGYCASAEFNGNSNISIALPAWDNPDPNAPDLPALTFAGNVTLSRVVSEMCKPGKYKKGTEERLEWQKAGENVKGVTGTLTTAEGGYALILTFGAKANEVQCNEGTKGQENMVYTRSYTITQGDRNGTTTIVSGGVHHVYNVASIPEPETLTLLLAGLGAMAFLARRGTR